jgi:HEAT repeat protein
MATKRVTHLQKRLYTRVPLLGTWLRRRAAKALAQDGSPEAIRALAEAVTRSSDARVCSIALETLRHVDAQPAIDAACAVWAATRHAALADVLTARAWVASAPLDVRVLTALKMQRRELTAPLGPEVVAPLLAACSDDDSTVAQQARLAVGELANPETRVVLADTLCARWAETRAPQLADLMVQGHYVAQQPLAIRVLSALKTEQPHLLTALRAEVIEPLLQACEDSDASICAQARLTLQRLDTSEAREALCRFLIDQDHAIAREAALQGQYAPRDEYQRALFFFLTEQWERYDVLDFNRHLLSSLYASADPPLRQRLTEKLRLAGRTDFLTILVGSDTRSRAADMTPDETAVLVHMLVANKEWPRLWALVFILPLTWSMRIIQLLAQNAWKPEPGDGRATFEALITYAAPAAMVTHDDLRRAVPPAVQRARARVAGRVNDVAFSPVRPVIAVGTGQRKLVLWNFQHAQREQVLDAFDHSIGRVAFTHGGTLLCAERTQTAAACALHAWQEGKRWRLEQPGSAVTALVPVGEKARRRRTQALTPALSRQRERGQDIL